MQEIIIIHTTVHYERLHCNYYEYDLSEIDSGYIPNVVCSITTP